MNEIEMLNAILKNPKLKFLMKNRVDDNAKYAYIFTGEHDKIQIRYFDGRVEPFVVSFDDYHIYDLVEDIITWQEAIEEWSKGHVVMCKVNKEERIFNGEFNLLDVEKRHILNGIWYLVK